MTKILGQIALALIIFMAVMVIGVLITALIKFGVEDAKEKTTRKKDINQAFDNQRELNELKTAIEGCKQLIVEAYCNKWFIFKSMGVIPIKEDKRRNAMNELELQIIRCGHLFEIMCWEVNIMEQCCEENTNNGVNIKPRIELYGLEGCKDQYIFDERYSNAEHPISEFVDYCMEKVPE